MQAKLLAMASKMELMQQVSYHLLPTFSNHLPPQTLRHREIELADPRHMIRQARDQMLVRMTAAP